MTTSAKKEKLYKIPIRRVGYSFRLIEVIAKSEEAAIDKALETAGDYLYTETSSEYEYDN